MEEINECENCRTIFEWKRRRKSQKRKYCSKKCAYQVLGKRNEKQFKWDNASSEEKFQRMKQNFEERVKKKEGCWIWTGAKDKNGYGQMQIKSHTFLTKAHRISWMIYKGEIPKNVKVCHSCDNPECTNPEHLFLGTSADNSKDMTQKQRQAKGKKIKQSKLTENDVKNIKKLLKLGVTSARLAKDYKVSNCAIHNIKYKITWKHIPEE